MNLERLRENLEAVRARIVEAARRAGREDGAARLVAVTKRNPAAMIRPLVALGQHDLGENYPQELWRKREELEGLDVRWHLIGHLQGNKARRTYPLVTLLHAVDSLKLLRLLDEQASESDEPAPVLLQVNCSAEAAKHGWSPDGLLAEAESIASVRRVKVAGLMTMAGYGTSAEEARPAFVRLREMRDELRSRTGMGLNQLSMGMSNDFEAAVEEGATWVRVGSALFEGVAP